MEVLANAFQLAIIVVPVMLAIRILQDVGILERFAAPRGRATRGGDDGRGPLFGLAVGAGVIIQQAREHKFTRREITLVALFLCACHAVVEDTLIFVPLGINVLPLILVRLAAAIALTLLIARLWR